jgi:hypothetical protein
VQLDRHRGESAAVVAQQHPVPEAGGDRRGLVGELAHGVAVPGAGGSVGGGLDQQPAFGRQPGTRPGQQRTRGCGQRDGSRLLAPARLPGEDGQVPRRLADRQRVAAARCEDAGAVGGHPAELLVIELDQHPRRQRVDPRQQRIALTGIAARREQVAGRDQPGQADRQPGVPAAPEVRQRAVKPRAHRAGRCLRRDGR